MELLARALMTSAIPAVLMLSCVVVAFAVWLRRSGYPGDGPSFAPVEPETLPAATRRYTERLIDEVRTVLDVEDGQWLTGTSTMGVQGFWSARGREGRWLVVALVPRLNAAIGNGRGAAIVALESHRSSGSSGSRIVTARTNIPMPTLDDVRYATVPLGTPLDQLAAAHAAWLAELPGTWAAPTDDQLHESRWLHQRLVATLRRRGLLETERDVLSRLGALRYSPNALAMPLGPKWWRDRRLGKRLLAAARDTA